MPLYTPLYAKTREDDQSSTTCCSPSLTFCWGIDVMMTVHWEESAILTMYVEMVANDFDGVDDDVGE